MSNKPRKYKTSFLFSRTNFIMGWGSIFNVRGNYFIFNYSKSGSEADARAIENDWGVIGQDIKAVIQKNPVKQFEFAK